jgi:hypothetical protein
VSRCSFSQARVSFMAGTLRARRPVPSPLEGEG